MLAEPALGAQHRRQLTLLGLSRILETLAAGMMVVALPLSLGRAGDGSAAHVGWLLFGFGLAMAGAQPIATRLLGRGTSAARIARLGLLGFAVSAIGLASAHQTPAIFAWRTLQGMSMGLVIPTLVHLVGRWGGARPGRALGLYGTVRMIGFGLGPVVGATILSLTSLEFLYYAVALLALASLVPLSQVEDPVSGAESGLPRTSASALFSPLGMTFTLAAFSATGSATALLVLENDFLERPGFGPVEFGLGLSAMLVTRLLLDWRVGRLADELRGPVLPLCGLVILAIGTLLLASANAPSTLIGARIIMGVGMAAFATPALALFSGRTGGATVVTLGFSLGVALGPVWTGELAARFGVPMALGSWALLSLGCAVGIGWQRSAGRGLPAGHGEG